MDVAWVVRGLLFVVNFIANSDPGHNSTCKVTACSLQQLMFFYIFNLISFIEQMEIAVKQQSAQEWTQLYRVHTICTIFRCSFPSFSLAKNTPLHHATYQWWSSCVQCHLLYSCVIVPMLSRWKLIIVSSKPSGRDCWNNCGKQTRYSNDWTIVEIGRNKILWFVSVW